MKIFNFSIFVLFGTFLNIAEANSDAVNTCNKTEWKRCLQEYVDAAFEGTGPRHCSNLTSEHPCVIEHYTNCRSHIGPVLSSVVSPYIPLLNRVHEKSCKNNGESQMCDVDEAKSCIKDFMVVLTSGHLGDICRQTSLALNCLSPVLERCTGLQRYLVALVADEIQLTSDLWCSERSCRFDIASQCIEDGMRIIDYPVAIEMQSNLICSGVKSSLACASNHTELCDVNAIPQSLSDGFMQLYQFSAAYCGTGTIAGGMTSGLPRDLVAPVYLAALTVNEWTSVNDMCSMYNATLKTAAAERISMATSVESLLTWQQVISISLDKLSDTCLNNDTFDCKWVTAVANQNPVCEVDTAERCVDTVLLSKLTVDVNLMRSSWQTVCSVAYDMLACAQYHTGACVTSNLSRVRQLTQEVEELVGFECSQLGATGSQEACNIEHHTCDSANAVHECIMYAYELEDRCQEQNNIYSCFKDHLYACNSVQKVPAQFYMEWLLNNCTHNLTLLDDDMYLGVSQCKMQYGYNIFNGILAYSDFNTIICTVTSLYRQCLADQSLPSLATLYMQEVDDFYSIMQQTMCNNTGTGVDLSAVSESEECNLSETAGTVTLSIEFYSNFPFISLKDQEVVCWTYPPFKDLWTYRAASCSTRRQTVISDAIVYFDNIHQALCSVSRPDAHRSCDVNKANMCLEDFGAFTYFSTENSDICGKLEETYECLIDSSKACDEATHNALLQEVKTMHSLLGNITCPKMQWCDADNTTDWYPWQHEICSDWDQCLIFDWMSCVDQYNLLFSCQSYTEGVACIEEKLSSCDPLQVLLAKSEISQWAQANSACNVVPNDPSSVTQVYRNIFQCSSSISETQDVSKQSLCTVIDAYLNCLASLDQTEVLYVWRGILGRNGQLWRKRLYLDCQIASTEKFIVGQDFNPDNITRQFCTVDSRFCLRAFTNLAVTYFHIMPLSERFPLACERAQFQYECVMTQASGCISPTDRYLLTSAEWIREGFGNVGTCSSETIVHRECNPGLALQCISELGHVLIEDMESMSLDIVCSKLQLTSMCVNQRTSSCDYYTRSDVTKTFNQIAAIVKGVCTPSPPSTAVTSCLPEGEATQCDLEEALICMVPVQAMLLHPNSTWEQICRSIPEMKSCVYRTTSGCDDVTLTIVSRKLHRLSHRLNDQCPQFYCEECTARSCLVNLQRNLQYENASLCGSVAEAKQCIYQNAGYCEPTVSESLLREITLLVGEDAYLCEITLPSCLQTFMLSAYQITSYTPMTNVSSQNDFVLGQMCNEANAAFYCVSQHLTSIEGQRLQIMNSTLQKIGNIVYGKCQGSQLQCYSCANATSNEECNQQRVQTCSPDMQMCGTVFTGTVLNKGCVRPDLCQNGCNGTMCSMCCGTNLCNQPWNNVILEPANCQPETALYCGFQLLTSLVQNDTINCITLQESLSCMIQSTQDCMSSKSMSLGLHARDLLTRDVMTVCIDRSPVCSCGQCTSMLLLSVVSSPFGNADGFCRTVFDMYNKTLNEMDLTNCSMGYIQSTAYNLQVAAYMIQGICSMENIDNTSCHSNGVVYNHGASFMAQDGCNYCTCDRGNIACTLMYCPPEENPQCPNIDPDQVGFCVEMCSTDSDCVSGQICCSNGCGHTCTDPKPQGTDGCNYGNITYSTGDSFLATDDCNFCYCYNGVVSCTEMYCPSGNGSCNYNGKLYNNGDSFMDADDCNSCFCNSGNIACTLMYCPPDNRKCPAVDENQVGICVEMCASDDDCDSGQLCCSNGCGHVCTDLETEETKECAYDDMIYSSGDSFLAEDGCNTCFCHNGIVGCTRMYCPTEGVCDILGVQACINEAALPYLVSMVTGSSSRHVCLSAANLLKCVEPKVKGCPMNILNIVHSAVWWNIETVQSLCDLNDIIWSFYNNGWQINTTVPDITGKCSAQKAVKCFSNIDESCSSYQSMIDCVYNFTTGCLTVDMVPVLFELEHHIEGWFTACDLIIPEQNVDPFYPIAQCMTEFGKSLNNELALMYLNHGQLGGVCDNIDVLVGCLYNITGVQPAGKFFIENLVESLSNLVKLCNDWNEENQPDHVACHHCQGFTDMERCDSMPLQDCHPNQVCATSLQLDPNTGFTMVTKGCADLTWCQMSHGCNAQFMSCVACCHGDICNSADNMTSHTTEASTQNTWRTTSLQPTKPWSTTSKPHVTTTDSYGTCQIYRISTLLTTHVLRLMTFNFLPIYDRDLICKNFENTFATISDHLDPNCPEIVTTHVQKLIDWLTTWSSDVCGGDKNEEKCMEAIHCVSNTGNFTDNNSTCRSISETMKCLQSRYQYCNIQGQMSINNTRHILSDMKFVICEPNILTKGSETEECVSLATSDLKTARCDADSAMKCARYVQKAFYNPFMAQDDFCSIAKQGLTCIRDNTFNCSMDALGSMSSAVMDIVHGVNNLCPDVWCPADEQCTLEPAWKCLASLETEVEKQMLAGNFSRGVCKSITRTHHCIMNATQNCNIPATQRMHQQFNAIVLLTSSWCNEEPTNHSECLNSLHHGIDNLVNFDIEFVNHVLKMNLQMVLTSHVLSKHFDNHVIKHGMEILGLDSSLLQHLENNSDIFLPAVIGYLFEHRNFDGINLPALSGFMAEVISAKQNGGGVPNNPNGTLDSILNGINLPGGLGQNDGNGTFGGGLNLPGGTITNNQNSGGYADGGFGYGLNLPGGYGGSSFINDIDGNIKNITAVLFRSNIYTGAEMTNQILRILNKTVADVAYMIDENSLVMYKHHKNQLCNVIHESLHCVYGNLYNSFMTSSKRQEFVITTTLKLLDNLANELCLEDQCYSCNGLHSNDECNMQPLTTCGPLQVCQAKFTGGHFFKGCASALTCEEECQKGEGHCYCCHGSHCNKDKGAAREAVCEIQPAVDAAYDLLSHFFVTEENYKENSNLLYAKSAEMIRATEGCYGVNLNNFGTEGKRIIKLLEAKNCTKNHMSQNCDIAGLNTLTSLIFSPYYTTESLESVCRLFDEVASEVISKFSEGKCCDVTAIETLITVYQHIHPHCRHLNIGPVCEVTVHLSCPSHSDKTSNTNRSKNSTIGDSSQFKNNGFISKLCSQFSSQSQRELNNQSESDVAVEKTGCDVSDIVSKCLGSFTGCSDTALEDLTLCVQNHTASCSAVQIVPVAMTFDRIAFSCGRDISRVPDYVSVEIEHQYHCLQELAKMNTASTPETPLKISLCKTMNSVSSCLVSSEIPGALVPKMYFNGVEGNVNRFKEFICTHDSAETEEENSGNGTCDIAAISETALHYINFALTSPPMIGNDACIFAMELETLRNNLTTCSGMHNHPLDGVLSWIQKEVKVTCDANLAAVMCQQSNCDVTMTTNLLKQLGYYLLVTNFNDMVFCKKVANVLHGVECLADSCREDMTSLHAEVLYIRSVVGTRCPDLTYYLHCSDGMMKGQQNNARNITNGDRIQKESVNETKNGVNGTGIAETCNVMQSKMCVNSVRLPAAVDGLYCSKMMSVMKQLSDCVLPKLRGCTSAELTDAVTHYQTLFTRRRQYCPTDFLTHLFGELMDGDHCEIPQCFTAADCYKHFKAKEEGNCGNLDDIEQCVFYATEGCNYFQQQASMITLQAFVVQEGLPKECLKSKLASMNTSTDKLIECVLDFNQQMSDILSGNMTGSPSCHLMTSYITCLETTLELADIPTVVKEPFNHLVLVAKPATEIVCKQKDDELSQEQKPRKEHGNETCGTEKGLYCLKKFSANVLLSPLFSYDGKQMICSHLSERSNCLADALSECSHDEITNPYYNVYSLIEMLSQLTGVCSPSPFTCSPEIAMECVSHLGYVLRARSYLEDVCFVLQQTELCIRQTTSSCESFTKNSVLKLYEPIRCKAYSVCPSAIQISDDVSRETPESCIDPTEVVAHSGTCRPFVALRCLQDVNDAATGTTKDRNATCRNYESALTCFFNNLNACDDDVTIMMSMYYLLEVSNVMDKMCFTTIKHDCDSAEETECDLDQLEDCIEHFRGIEEFGTAKERCLARTDVKHCFEVTTRSCPKITRLYAKTRFLKNTLREADNEENMCDNVHQCIFNYMAYFNVTLSHQSRHLNGDNDQKNPETSLKTVSKQKHDPMKMYQCHARLDELSCIQSHLEMLPEDVAMVAGNLLMHMDNAFADVCAVQVGLLPDLQGCNQSCIECLQNRIQMQSDILLTFVSDTMNASSNTPMFSSSKFCRLFEKLKASRNDSFNKSCFDKPDDLVWHSRHMNDMANLYDKYCNRPCNTTQADICINQLESDISSLGKEGSCLSFNETLKCLEDSVTSCEANVTNQYFNQAETIFRNTGITCYIMPSFEVSYSSTELVMMEGEMSQQMSISVTMTRPVMDSCYGSSCHMEVFVSMEQVVAECSSGQEIPQILMNNCVYIFDVNNTASTHQFNFYPRVDHKVEDKRNVTVNVIGQLWEDGSLATGDVLATVTMVLEDRDSSGVCYLISEPTIKTFDNVLYYSFSQGEYILYQHDTLQEKVHVGFQRCRRSSVIPCPCVVMVQSGDDTFIIDRCRRSGELYHALEFKVYKNNDITEQTRVYTLTNRNFFQFVLPSGAIVNVRSGRFLLDVWIKPSALDFGHTSGLCGTYDGDRENDFTLPDASVEVLSDVLEWRGNFLPLTFVNSWRPENTLFGGVQESDNSLPSELLGTKCACTNLTCTPTDIVETCDFISGVDITADLELYTQIIEVQTRRRRQTENVWDNIDYDPENPTGQLPTWPTGSGLTEEGAIQTCESALRNHASWDICSVAVDTTSIVSSCVTDMLLSDTDEFVSEYVEDMKLQCKVAVLSDPSIASLLSQTQEELVSYLLTLTCLNDCSGRGQCVNDVCQCDAGYLGDDCSGSLDTAPAITSLSENIYSGVAGSGLTVISRQVVVYGSGFENSNNLTCHTKQVEVSDTGYRSADIVSSSRGTFLTSGTLLCEMFGSLPLTGLLLSVSNNGVNQSNGVMYIFQDPVCFDCDPDAETCNNQSTSCVIEGQCYAAGVYNPTDQCLLCDPVSNFWIFKPSSTCVTTSTSTTSSSTSSTSSTTSTTSSTSSSTISSTDSTSSSTSSTTSSTSPSTSSSSSTTSSSTSASSSTSPSTSVSSPTSPSPSTPSTTQPGQEGDKDEQDGDKEDTQTFNIVIITGACVVVLIVVVTAIFAYRLRRKDIRTSKAGSSVNSSEPPPRKQGQTNPGYSRGEAVRPIAGDPVIQPRRITPLYSAAFNTEGLEGRAGAPDIYEDDPGLHTVNIEIFDEGRGRSRERPTGERPVMYDPEYDNAGLERRYTIPRPYVAPQPAGIYPEVRRQGVDADYDNVTPERQGADKRESPMPDYYEADGADVTRM